MSESKAVRFLPMKLERDQDESDWMDWRLTIALSSSVVVRIGVPSVVLVVILILGAGFRFLDFDRWSLWTDELYSWRFVQSLRILTDGIPDDQHPPLYYILMHFVIRAGESESWLRLPSAVAGFLAIPLNHHIGVLIKKHKWGLLAAALLAVSPLHIWYSREARMYGVASLLWVMSILFFVRLLKKANWLDVIGLSIATLAGILTAYPTLGLWGMEILAFFFVWNVVGRGIGRFLKWLSAQALIFGGCVLWWPFFKIQLERGMVFSWPVLPWLGLDVSGTLAETVQLAVATAAVFMILTIAMTIVAVWKPHLLSVDWWPVRSLTLGVATMLLVVTVLGAIPRGLSIRRQLLVFYPPLLMVGAWAILRLFSVRFAIGVMLLSFIMAIISVVAPPAEDWRGATEMVRNSARENDQILLTPGWTSMAFDYYVEGDISYTGADRSRFFGNDSPPYAQGDQVWLVTLDNYLTEGQNKSVLEWLSKYWLKF